MTLSKKALRLAVLLSGSGTTLQNLLARIADGRLHAHTVLVISNNADAYGLVRAENVGIPTVIVDRKECGSREGFSRQIFERIRQSQADLVCLAGFLQLL